MKASVRCEALDLKGLARAERHGKREDWISQQRRIRKVDPLTLGGATDAEGLNLADLYAAHIDGAKMNKAARKTVLHFIIHYPEEVLADGGPVPGFAALPPEEREKRLLQQAVDFVNRTHGGEAVFAARLDRDEAGRTNVDVFATPKYLKPSKSVRREPSLWISATRFGEALARKHQDHIRERLDEAEVRTDRDGNEIPLTSPRAVGMALQEEFHEWFAAVNGVALEERTLKESRSKDRVEVEEWRLRKMREEAAQALRQRDEALTAQQAADAEANEARAAADAAKAAQVDAEAKTETTRQERDKARAAAEAARAAQAEAKAQAEAARQERDQARTDEAAARAKAGRIASALEVLTKEIAQETIGRNEAGRVVAKDTDGLKQGFPDLKPAVNATADAMVAKRRMEAEAAADRHKASEALKAAYVEAETHQAAALSARSEAEAAKAETFRLRDKMKKAYGLLRLTLSRFGKYLTNEERAEADEAVQQVERLLNPPASSPEDPVEQPKGAGDDLGL